MIATRRDVVFCTKACRQAAHRAKVEPSPVDPGNEKLRPLALAYADPPYPGKSGIYRGHPDYAGEVDLHELLDRLVATYAGWALSTSAAALPVVLGLALARDPHVRVAAWVRGARPHQQARIVNAWEPVIYHPVRRGRSVAQRSPVLDVSVGPTPRRRPTNPADVIGAKPPAFCRWVFELIGARRGDTLADLYPGSGIVGRTWEWYQGRDPSRGARA